MKPISPEILFRHCYGRYAVPAVNVFTMEQVLSLFEAAQQSNTPVIVQITPAARNYATPEMLLGMVMSASKIYDKAVYALHLDHGNEAHALAAINEGYTSVMIDASHDTFEENVRRTVEVVKEAKKKRVAVEAELGVLSGVEDDLSVDESKARYTDPSQAAEFVRRTGCTSLAVAVGTSHGAYKFSGGKGLQFDVLSEIQHALPGFPLVLHGASNVSKGVVDEINHYGGNLQRDSRGVSDEEIRKAVQFGVCKVNIATDLRLLWTKVHRRFFSESPELFDPTIPGKVYMREYVDFIIQRFEVLGCLGKAGSVKYD